MYVGSYLGLHTMLIGWMIYDLIWEILLQTGAIFVPILWIIIRNWRDASMKSVKLPPAELSAKKNLWDLTTAMLVIFFVCVPAWSLAPTTVKYQPNPQFTDADPAPVDQTTDPSTYADGLGEITYSAGDPQVPVWWYFLLSFSGGVVNAVSSNLPTPGDITAASQQIAAGNIKDAKLAHELQAFTTDCFTNARAKYSQYYPAGRLPGASSPTITYGPEEADWIGSRIFMETPGLYLPCGSAEECGGNIATRPVEGFAVNPSCADWWGKANTGLRDRLYNQADNDLWTGLRGTIAALGTLDPERFKDIQVQTMLANYAKNERGAGYGSNYMDPYRNEMDVLSQGGTWAAGRLKELVGLAGTTWTAATFAAKMHVVKMALPMIQAILLMIVIAVMPIVMVAAAYEIETAFTMSVVVFSLVMLSALWSIAAFAEFHITQAMYPENTLVRLLTGNTGNSSDWIKGMLLGMATAGLFIFMPIAWFYALVWAGQRAGGNNTASLTEKAGKESDDAGKAGPGLTTKAVKAVKAGK